MVSHGSRQLEMNMHGEDTRTVASVRATPSGLGKFLAARQLYGAALPAVDLPVQALSLSSDALLSRFDLTDVSAPLTSLAKYLLHLRSFRLKREAVWRPILPDFGGSNFSVISGRSEGAPLDEARQELGLVPAALRALLRLIQPSFLSLFEGFDRLDELLRRLRRHQAPLTLDGLAFWLAKAQRGKLRSLDRVPSTKTLLIPFGGAVSNSLAAQHLEWTRKQRSLHLVSRFVKSDQVMRLESVERIASLREKKSLLVRDVGHVEVAEEWLDQVLRYEIWDEHQCIYSPHEETRAHSEYVRDAVLVVLSPVPSEEFFAAGSWVLSLQSLHGIGGLGLEVFQHPEDALGPVEAQRFGRAAAEAVEVSGGLGFEALLEVVCRRDRTGATSPRSMNRVPTLEDGDVRVYVEPRPLRALA